MVEFFGTNLSEDSTSKTTIIRLSGSIYTPSMDVNQEKMIVDLFNDKGPECFLELEGKFALALWDGKKQIITLARDRMGQEPLYYHVVEEGVYFATDLKALQKKCKKKFEIDLDVLANYMWNMYIPAPYSIFEQVRKVKPGCYVTINLKEGTVKEIEYWNAREVYNGYLERWGNDIEKTKHYIHDFEMAFRDSVERRMPSGKSIGVFLSSGFDSTLVAAMGSEVSATQIHSFTIGFSEKEYNEADVASEIAKKIGTKHHQRICGANDAIEYLRKIPKVYSEPFADNSQIPMMMAAELASEYVDITLSGDGGDELLCGYPHYYQNSKYQKAKLIGKMLRKMPLAAPKDSFGYAYWRWYKACAMTGEMQIINADALTALPIVSRLFGRDRVFSVHSEFLEDAIIDGSLAEKFGYWGMKLPLEGDSLVKVGKAAEMYGLDNGMPFLDSEVLEICMKMPIDIKYQDGLTKYPVRKIVYDRVPRRLMDTPKKGFGIPINKWLREELGEQLAAYFEPEFIRKQGIFDAIEIQCFYKAFREKSSPILDRIAWTYFCFQMWWEHYLSE